ncbi:uncharacterized protein SCHCODRAFT_01173975 [Schizophyllum commune H4-8]|nr:uncharacterized protein SCHCODRAFT_01173975 [Schizophyllum commune H4-8]KAI5889579.1 hypothetical protein SCHCODRAFT_01173975 [Schizophyllum commune H4-8]
MYLSQGPKWTLNFPKSPSYVCSQGAGKPSLIESISGITLPRAAGTCTRCPTECRLSRSGGRWQWADLDPIYQKYLRTPNLIKRLSDILSDLIEKRRIYELPEIHEEIEATLRRTQRAPEVLPPTPSPHPFSDIQRLVHAFVRDAEENVVKGVPDEDGLLQTIRPEHDKRKEGKRMHGQPFMEEGRDGAGMGKDVNPGPGPVVIDLDAEESEASDTIYVDEVAKV